MPITPKLQTTSGLRTTSTASDKRMGNVTEHRSLDRLRARLQVVLDSYRPSVQNDQERLLAAMREYESTCKALRKAA